MKIRGQSVWQVLGLYLAGGWVLLQVVDVLVDNVGLPQRVFTLALTLLAIGCAAPTPQIVEVPKEAEVQGTFFMLQKKDYHPTFNEWFRESFVEWCKERGWPLDISYVAGYTGDKDVLGTSSDLGRRARRVLESYRPYLLAQEKDDVAYVAAGILDGFWEIHLGAWDVAAGSLLVEEAGGRVTAFDGGDAWLHGGNIVASNGRIHDDVSSNLTPFQEG